MARNTQMAITTVNHQASVLAELLSDGFLDFYDGDQPGAPEDMITDQTFLGSIRFSSPAMTEPVDGVIYALPSTDGFVIAKGIASWARVFKSDHKTPLMDVSVGTRDSNVLVETTTFERGAIIGLISFEHSVGRSSPGM